MDIGHSIGRVMSDVIFIWRC